ncbi:pre-mRNA processing factor 3-domain-containing protein [Blastocladiella britannica]|nr:pre-mRNA processing factor 3-domain-containing protein [Blastocladiella britannica]
MDRYPSISGRTSAKRPFDAAEDRPGYDADTGVDADAGRPEAKRARLAAPPTAAAAAGSSAATTAAAPVDFEQIKRQIEAKKRAMGLVGRRASSASPASAPTALPSSAATAARLAALLGKEGISQYLSSSAPPDEPKPAQPQPQLARLEIERPRIDRTDVHFDPSVGIPVSKTRRGRSGGLRFVAHGKYTQKADRMRAETRMAELRASVSGSIKRSGLDAGSALDLISDAAVRRDAPPLVEWWDLPLTHGHPTYEVLLQVPASSSSMELEMTAWDDPDLGEQAPGFLLFDKPVPVTLQAGKSGGSSSSSNSNVDTIVPVNHLVQHPVPLPPPYEATSAPRKAILTKAESKKMRRQRRMEEQREKQDKIRLGLMDPEPPKVRLANMNRVLAHETVSDPTKIEKMVRAQAMARQRRHEADNEKRKLTPEQRRAKKDAQRKRDEQRGIHVALFKCKDMSHPKLKFKIDANVQQLGLTGVAAIHKDLHMVCVEGGPRAIRYFKRLMLRRMRWTNLGEPGNGANGGAPGGAGADGTDGAEDAEGGSDSDDGDSDEDGNDEDASGSRRGGGRGDDGLTAGAGALFTGDPSDMPCWLVWEGKAPQRAFADFRFKTCALEKYAVSLFASAGCEHHWHLTKNWVPPRLM